MFALVGIPVIAQVVIPLGLLGWLAFGRHPNRVAWALSVLMVGAYHVLIAIAGLWLVVPPAVGAIYLVLFLLACLRSVRSLPTLGTWPRDRRGRVGLGVRAGIAVALAELALHAAGGWRPPAVPAVELSFPLRGNGYYVANGGSLELLNAHLATLTDGRLRAYRGQSYGVDIVRLNGWGVRAWSPLPSDPAAYVIFGAPVFAPCAGTVATAVDGIADQSPPTADRAHMAGNHVVLDCGGTWVLLGHLRQGSVSARTGDTVCVGQRLGSVGNTGNTGEPHLHVHAQRPGIAAEPFGGDPLSVRFAGRNLVRNARVSGPVLRAERTTTPGGTSNRCVDSTQETP